jgi:rod shape determining protein RodA
MVGVHDLKTALQRMDWLLLAAVLMLVTAGITFIYSAGFQGETALMRPFYKRQLVWGLVGIGACVGIGVFDYRIINRYVWGIYGFAIALLVLVFFVGVRVHGSYRWLSLMGVRVQPSEFAKLATIITLASYLGRPGLDVRAPRTTLAALAIAGLPFILIAAEPDLGTAMVLVPVTFIMMVMAGVPWRILGLLILVGILMLPVGWFALDEYQHNRILVFWDPGRDPLGAGWNKIQSEIAVGSGGIAGKGFLKGTQNILGFLPRTVAPTDFIFSVIAEESGFVGCATLILLYGVFLARCTGIALVARDRIGQLMVVGLATMLFTHVFINIAMTIGLMPITGLPLPFISYGGSFMLGVMMAVGLIQSVYIRRYRN